MRAIETILTLLTAVLLTTAALADETPMRWQLLSAMTNAGLIDDQDVKASVRNADVEIARITDAFKKQVCGDRKAYENPVAFAKALEDRVTAINKVYAAELGKLDAKLLASGHKAEIDAQVSNARATSTDRTSENIQRVRNGEEEIGPLLDRVCNATTKQ